VFETLQDNVLTKPFYNAIVRLIEAAPDLAEFFIMLLIGAIIAWIVKKLIVIVFKFAKFDKYAYRVGVLSLMKRTAVQRSPSEIMGSLAFWVFFLAIFSVSINALGFEYTSNLAIQLINFIPKLIIALLIFAFGYIISSFISRTVLLALINANFRMAPQFAALLKILMLIIFAAMSIEQLGIAPNVIIATISIVFGGFILALAIAFGLGGKEIAREVLDGQLKRRKEEIDKEEKS